MPQPQKQVAIITGAGSGIGREVALRLSASGFGGMLVGRRREALEATASMLSGNWSIHAADLGDLQAAAAVIDAAALKMGRVDVLVNNAAAAVLAPIQTTTEPLLHQVFAPNAFAPALMVGRLWPLFRNQQSGCVINVSSMAASSPFPGLSVYAASKAALESLTRSIVIESRQEGLSGIRAFSIAPGAVETPMLRSMFTTRDLPRRRTLDAAVIAAVIVDCILGRREEAMGQTISIPSP